MVMIVMLVVYTGGIDSNLVCKSFIKEINNWVREYATSLFVFFMILCLFQIF